jgi:hypothetical protein
VSALDELREHLRDAAQRDVDAKRVRRRRQRRATGLVAAALVAGTAIAGAADLIAVGEPFEDLRVQGADYKPPPGALQPTILATARSGRKLPYAVGVYKANNGTLCLVAGSLRGYTLGREKGGRFRPYERGHVGSCNQPGRPNFDTIILDGRTLIYGRATAAQPHVRVTVEGRPTDPELQRDRGFLLVYDGKLDRQDIRIVVTAAAPNCHRVG